MPGVSPFGRSARWTAASRLPPVGRRAISGAEGLLQVAVMGRAGKAGVQEGDPGANFSVFAFIQYPLLCIVLVRICGAKFSIRYYVQC
jgi:hypothetical protein